MNNKHFYSNGKLLITGEYVVLDGAKSLAIPTKYGQSLTVEPIDGHKLFWSSFDHNGVLWFEGEFDIKNKLVESSYTNETAKRLVQILNAAKTLNPNFLKEFQGYRVSTRLDFPTNWGLGTSSTLINNMAQWAKVDPYKLLNITFGGSGYDIACAMHDTALTYSISNGTPLSTPVVFNPNFKNKLYFVHLNKKQNSREGIKYYHENKTNTHKSIQLINEITNHMIQAETLSQFEHLVTQHELLISEITNQTPVKSIYFKDFNGTIKSLGAWGGDFILATSKEDPIPYFYSKGFKTVIPFNEMILE